MQEIDTKICLKKKEGDGDKQQIIRKNYRKIEMLTGLDHYKGSYFQSQMNDA